MKITHVANQPIIRFINLTHGGIQDTVHAKHYFVLQWDYTITQVIKQLLKFLTYIILSLLVVFIEFSERVRVAFIGWE